jgi:hypothetical protein
MAGENRSPREITKPNGKSPLLASSLAELNGLKQQGGGGGRVFSPKNKIQVLDCSIDIRWVFSLVMKLFAKFRNAKRQKFSALWYEERN